MHRSYITRPAAERFWSKVDKSGACWLWTTGRTGDGYGAFYVRRDGRDYLVRAHRFSYELAHGPIPEGAVVRHSCDTPLCVNPAHLLIGTVADNNADMHERSRINPPRGDAHWSRHNTTSVPRGERQPHARMTEDKVRDMRQRFADGAALRDLVAEFGMSLTAVWQIVHRQRWRHVA
jgi:hypothetical protein